MLTRAIPANPNPYACARLRGTRTSGLASLLGTRPGGTARCPVAAAPDRSAAPRSSVNAPGQPRAPRQIMAIEVDETTQPAAFQVVGADGKPLEFGRDAETGVGS